MVKAQTTKALLKGTPIIKFETRPWKCPRCFKRVKTQAGLIGHWKAKHERLPIPKLIPSARDGLKLKETRKVKKKSRAEVLKRGRQKGQKAPTRVRDIDEMRKGVEEYEKALESGEA